MGIKYKFTDIVDIKQIQLMLDHMNGLTGLAVFILDPDGEILAATGWQKICRDFHRVNHLTLENCHESDNYILSHLMDKHPLDYRCKNGVRDIAVPLLIEDQHVATLFFGQFFYDDDVIDEDVFRRQAKEYGFPEDEYLKSMREVPVLSHQKVDSILSFYKYLALTLAESGYNRMMLKKEKVDELLQKEREVRHANVFLDTIISNLPNGIQIFDRDGYSRLTNKKQREYLGIRNPEEGIGSFNLLTDPFAIAHGLDKIFKRVSAGETVSSLNEYDFSLTKDRWVARTDKCYLKTIFFPIMDDNREVSNVISFMEDVTERKLIETQLQQSEEKYRRLTEGIPGIVYIVSLKQGGVYYSEGVEKILGYKRNQLYDNPYLWRDSIYEDDRSVYSEFFKQFHGEKNSEIQYRIRNVNGERLWLLDRPISRIERDGETFIEGLAIDISELMTVREKLNDLIDARNKFISVIGHDLKGPMGAMTSILGQMSELIKEGDLKSLEMFRNELEKSSVKTMNLLIDILDWARAQSGALVMKVEPIILKEIIEEIISFFNNRIAEKDIACITDCDGDISLNGDKNMIKTVVRNLLSNAVKFTPAGGSIHIHAYKEEGATVFRIEDTGIGIKKDKLDLLFHIGSHFSTAGTNAEKGSGLGLILCKEFIEKHQGTIKVESIEGKGSVFTFRIPSQ